MAINAGRAEAHLDLNYSKFKKGIQESMKEVKSLGKDVSSTGKNMSKAFADSQKEVAQYERKLASLGREKTKYTNSVEKLRNKQEALNNKIEKSARDQELYRAKIASTENQLERYNRELTKTGVDKEQLNQKINKGRIELKQYENQLQDNVQKQEKWQRELNQTERELKQSERAVENITKEYNQYEKELKDVKSAQEGAEKSSSALGRALKQAGVDVDGLGGKIGKLGKQFTSLGGLLSAMGATIVGAFKLGTYAMKGFVDDAMKVGRAMAVVGTAIGAVLAKASKEFMDFQNSLENAGAIAGATANELDLMGERAEYLGATTAFTGKEVADAFGYMAMAGWDASQMLAGINDVVDLSIIGGTELALTSDIVTDGITAMGLTAGDAGDFVAYMASAITNSNTTVALMGDTMKYATSIAGGMGIKMEDLSLAIGLMANAGIKGTMSGTALRAGLMRLVNPTDEGRLVMQKYGLEVAKNAQGNVDLNKTIHNLREGLQGLTVEQQAYALKQLFGMEASNAWGAIVNANEADVRKLESRLATATTTQRYWLDSVRGGNEQLEQYYKQLRKAGATHQEATEIVNQASRSVEDYRVMLMELGYTEEEANKITKNMTDSLDKYNKILENCSEKARTVQMSQKDLGLAITLLGKDTHVTEEDVNGLIDSLDKLNQTSDTNNFKVREIIKSNSDLSKTLADQGIEVDTLNFKNLSAIEKVKLLHNANKTLTEGQKQQLLSTLNLTKGNEELLEIMRMSDPAFQKVIEDMHDTKSASEELSEKLRATLAQGFEGVTSAINALLVDLGGKLEPALRRTFDVLVEGTNKIKDEGLHVGINYMLDEMSKDLNKLDPIIDGAIKEMVALLQTSFPRMLEIGGEIITKMCQGIINNKASINEAVSDAIKAIADFINNNFDIVIEAGKTIVDAIKNGMEQNEEAVTQAVDTFVSGCVRWLGEKAGLAMDAGAKFAGQIVIGAIQGLMDKLGDWTGGLSDYLLRPVQTFAGDTREDGRKLGVNLVDGAGEGAEGSSIGFMGKLASAIQNPITALNPSFWFKGKESGKSVTDGVGAGVDEGKEGVSQKLDTAVKSSTDRAKASGSQGGKGVGKATTDGTKQGLQVEVAMSQELSNATKALQRSATDMYNGAKVSFSKLSQVAKTEMSNMYKGVSTSFNNMANKCKTSSTDLYKGCTTSFKKTATDGKTAGTDLYKGMSTSFHNMADNCKQSATDLLKGSRTSFTATANAGKQAFSDLYNGTTGSSSRMKTKVIADWNAIRTALGGTIRGKVVIEVEGVQRALSQIAQIKNSAKRSIALPPAPKSRMMEARSMVLKAETFKAKSDYSLYDAIVPAMGSLSPIVVPVERKTEEKDKKPSTVNLTLQMKVDKVVTENKDNIKDMAEELIEMVKDEMISQGVID